MCAEKQSEGVRRCVPATHKRQSAPERGEGGWVESAWGREGERKRDETKKREEKKESKKEKKKEREKERKKEKKEKKITRERKSERERAREDERTSERERARERERGTERATERGGARESERERERGSTRGRERGRERERRVLHILKHVNKCFNAVKTFADEARAAEKARHALSDNTYTATSIHVYQCCCTHTHTHTSKSNMLVTAASPEAILFSSLCQSRALPRALTQHFMRTVPHKSNATLDPHTSASATCHRIWNQKARPCVKEAFCCGARRTLRH